MNKPTIKQISREYNKLNYMCKGYREGIKGIQRQSNKYHKLCSSFLKK